MNTPVIDLAIERKLTIPASESHWSDPLPYDAENADAPLVLSDAGRVLSAQRELSPFGSKLQVGEAARQHLRWAEEQWRAAPQNPLLANNFAAALRLNTQPEKAARVLKPFMESGAAIPNLQLNFARALVQIGDLKGAENAYSSLVAEHPESHEALLELGSLLFKQGRFEESAALFEKLLLRNPKNAMAANNLALIESSRNLNRAAIRRLRTAVRAHDRFAVAYNNLGLCQMRLGQPRKAEISFRAAIRLIPSFRSAYLNLAIALMRDQRPLEARVILTEATRRFPDDEPLLDMLSDALYALGDFRALSARLRETIARFGVTSARANNIGVAFSRSGRTADAEIAFREGVSLNDTEHYPFQNLAWLLANQERFAEAIGVANTAQERLGFSDLILETVLAKGVALMRLRRMEEAEQVLRQIVASERAPVLAAIALSSLYGEHMRRFQDSKAVLKDGLRKSPGDLGLLNNLAYACIALGELDEANEILSSVSHEVGRHPYLTATRGLYHLRRGHRDRGVALYSKAAHLAPRAERRRIRQKLEMELGREDLQAKDARVAVQHLQRSIKLGADEVFTDQARDLLRTAHALLRAESQR